MKTPAQILKPRKKTQTGRCGWSRKSSTCAYSARIYRIEKELRTDAGDALSMTLRLTDAHAQVGAEAARLSKRNRRRVITQRELNAAVHALRGTRS